MAYGRKTRKPKTALQSARENSVIKIVTDYLALKQIPHWRMNSGALMTERGQLVRYLGM
jgi:TusA-related sulfurtransferase